MAEAFLFIDVLVGQIDAAGEARFAVDDHELPVVAVVEPAGHDRHEGIERLGPDAPLGQLLFIAAGKGGDAAEIVVEDPHVQALGGLPF